MPVLKGKGKKKKKKNFHELRHGNQYKRTAKKFGKAKANKQMIAIVLDAAGESKRKKRKNAKKR